MSHAHKYIHVYNTYIYIICMRRRENKMGKIVRKFAVTIKDHPVDFKNTGDSDLITALTQTRSCSIFLDTENRSKIGRWNFPSPWRRWTFKAINAESSEDPPQQIHAGSSHDNVHISGIWFLSCIILTRNQRARKASVGGGKKNKTNDKHLSNLHHILKICKWEAITKTIIIVIVTACLRARTEK